MDSSEDKNSNSVNGNSDEIKLTSQFYLGLALLVVSVCGGWILDESVEVYKSISVVEFFAELFRYVISLFKGIF